jgi:hypothetical protein
MYLQRLRLFDDSIWPDTRLVLKRAGATSHRPNDAHAQGQAPTASATARHASVLAFGV